MENVIITVRISQNIFGNIYVYTNKYNKLNTEVIIMSIFDETVVKAKEVLDIAGKKTNDIISVQKIKMSIASLKSQLSKMYEALGRLCCDNGTETPSVNMLELMSEIEERIAEVKSLEKKLAALRGEKICTTCGTKNTSESLYCNKCGSKLPETEKETSDEETADAADASETCCGCGCETKSETAAADGEN